MDAMRDDDCPVGQAGAAGLPLNEELAGLVVALSRQLHAFFEAQVGQLDLTPPQAQLLHYLDSPLPMREVAGKLGCDASNVTGIVDRLEARGLLERRTDAADRRIKHLLLTAEGLRLRKRVEDLLVAAPGISGLTDAERLTLRDLLRRAVGTNG